MSNQALPPLPLADMVIPCFAVSLIVATLWPRPTALVVTVLALLHLLSTSLAPLATVACATSSILASSSLCTAQNAVAQAYQDIPSLLGNEDENSSHSLILPSCSTFWDAMSVKLNAHMWTGLDPALDHVCDVSSSANASLVARWQQAEIEFEILSEKVAKELQLQQSVLRSARIRLQAVVWTDSTFALSQRLLQLVFMADDDMDVVDEVREAARDYADSLLGVFTVLMRLKADVRDVLLDMETYLTFERHAVTTGHVMSCGACESRLDLAISQMVTSAALEGRRTVIEAMLGELEGLCRAMETALYLKTDIGVSVAKSIEYGFVRAHNIIFEL